MKVAIIGAFGSSVAYAFLLTTGIGRQFRLMYTWLSVVVGVGMTLGWLALVSRRAASLGLVLFAVTGAPIAALCVLEDIIRRREVRYFRSRD